jgi:hypothetical protein
MLEEQARSAACVVIDIKHFPQDERVIARRMDGVGVTVKGGKSTGQGGRACRTFMPIEAFEAVTLFGEVQCHIELIAGQHMNAEMRAFNEKIMP